MPFAELTTGARLHYIDTTPHSDAPVVVAVHGMLGTAEAHLGHTMQWLSQRGYRVIGPTMRGYGQSTPKPRDFPLQFYRRDAEDLLALLDVLAVDSAHLIGYSDGGEIALLAAGMQPERFASVAAWGAVGYFGPEMRPIAQRMVPGSAWLTQDEMAPHGLTDADAFARGWVRAVTHMIDAGGDVSLSLADRITCRVLIMLGRGDHLNPPAFAQRFINRTARGQLRLFDCGHAVHDEQTDAFLNTLGAFLNASSG